MALSASTIFQIQTTATASNVNGGGFNPANANMATDLACDANTGNTSSPVVSSASYNFVAGDVGHWLYVQAGTNWTPGWYQITATGSNKATLSAGIGAAIQTSMNSTPAGFFGTNTVAGVGTVNTPTGGTWTIDYSQSDATPFAITDLASTDGTTTPSTVTSALKPFGKNHVGNLMNVVSGTNWTVQRVEIVSVSTVTATLDKSAGSAGVLANGNANLGGALSLGASDDAIFELAVSSATAAARFFIKAGTYTIGGAVSVAASGNTNWPCIVEGYATTRGDRPIATTRPVFSCGANAFSLGTNFSCLSLQFIGTNAALFTAGTNSINASCKFTNTSTTAARAAATNRNGCIFLYCEFIAYRGIGLNGINSIFHIVGCYAHSCVTGIALPLTYFYLRNTIVESFITVGIITTNVSIAGTINCCTIYGSEAKIGTGVSLVTSPQIRFINNIIYGCATGVSRDTVSTAGYANNNSYYNNTADVNDVTMWQKGPADIAINPTFTNAAQVTGTTGKFAAANSTLIDTSANFTTLGVVPGRDFVYISAGTGITNSGMWVGITAISTTTNPNDTLDLDTAQGTDVTADKVYTIPIGHNFLPTNTALNGTGSPGVFPGALTTGYVVPGAVQPSWIGDLN